MKLIVLDASSCIGYESSLEPHRPKFEAQSPTY